MVKKIWMMIIAIAIISCENEAPIDYAIVSGNIVNKLDGDISIRNRDKSVNESITISEDGSFTDTLRIAKGDYMFFDGKNVVALHIEQGSVISFDYDATNFADSFSFTADNLGVSSYLLAKKKIERSGKNPMTLIQENDETEFKSHLQKRMKDLELLLENSNTSVDFKAQEKRNIYYSYLLGLQYFAKNHAKYAKKPDYIVSDDFLEELNSLDYDNEEEYFLLPTYKMLVGDYYTKQSTKLAEKEGVSFRIANIRVISEIQNEAIKSVLLKEAAGRISYVNPEDLDAFYNILISNAIDENTKETVTTNYNALKKVAKGMPSPKFIDYENFDGSKTSLDDFKGKFVYIDVWATWCGPCKAQIPFLKKVEKQYHDKNIEFVSISVDKKKDYEKWRKMVVDKELTGVQLIADNELKSDFTKDFLIRGIPRFILIDPAGNIIESNAPRPLDPKLIELFDELGI